MLFVYVTTANIDEAKKIAEKVVQNRLAACANILPQMYSIYHWQGKVEQATECVCIFKTTKSNFEELKQVITKLHSYETPCIVALPMTDIAEPFAKWINEETK